LGAALLLAAGVAGWTFYNHWTFPSDQTPEGAYARIVLAITHGHPRDCFPYLETRAEWASFSIHEYRAKSYARAPAPGRFPRRAPARRLSRGGQRTRRAGCIRAARREARLGEPAPRRSLGHQAHRDERRARDRRDGARHAL